MCFPVSEVNSYSHIERNITAVHSYWQGDAGYLVTVTHNFGLSKIVTFVVLMNI